MKKQFLMASVGRLPDASPGGVIAATMRVLANSAPTATGATLISPDGTVRYISRAEADRFVRGPKANEVTQ
jgi:hypothetical protein